MSDPVSPERAPSVLPEPPVTPPQSPKKPGGKRLWRAVLAVVVLVPVVFLAVGFYLLRSEPAHWKRHQQFLRNNAPSKIAAMANNVQSRLDLLSRIDSDDPAAGDAGQGVQTADAQPADDRTVNPTEVHVDTIRTMVLNGDELQAFVAEKFDEWMKARGYMMPEEIKKPMVALEKGRLVLAFEYSTPRFSQVFTARFNLRIAPSGMAILDVDEFLAGNLSIPAESVGAYLAKQMPDDKRVARVGQWLSKLDHVELEPVVKLEHRRRAMVKSYELTERGVKLTVRVQDYKTYYAGLHATALASAEASR